MREELFWPKFWARVDKSGECWLWTGAKLPTGYGVVFYKGRRVYVHRLMYEAHHGQIPSGNRYTDRVCVCHRCDNPSCVNPDHLWLGSQSENVQDMHRKGRAANPRIDRVTDEDAANIRRLRHEGVTLRAIAERYGVSTSYISDIVRGHRRNAKVRKTSFLSDEEVAAVRIAWYDGESLNSIARRFSISQQDALDIIEGSKCRDRGWPDYDAVDLERRKQSMYKRGHNV